MYTQTSDMSSFRSFIVLVVWVFVMLTLSSLTSAVLIALFGQGMISFGLWLACMIYYSHNAVYSRITNFIFSKIDGWSNRPTIVA